MNSGKRVRLARIFRRGRALILAIDHGLKVGPLRGIENPRKVAELAVAEEVDAIMASPPIIEYISDFLSDLYAIARVDGGATSIGPNITNDITLFTIEEAINVGADAVVAFGYMGIEKESVQIKKLSQVASECKRLGIPLIAEMLPVDLVKHHFSGGDRNLNPESIALAARVGWEVGADAVKTYYTGDPETFKRVVNSCPIPILVLGGPPVEDFVAFLEQIESALKTGAQGVIVGRNIWQHPTPRQALKALSKVVHEGCIAKEAVGKA
ncbi:MAG: hypothetical protein QW760_03760 [Thermofilaceae archaeon]